MLFRSRSRSPVLSFLRISTETGIGRTRFPPGVRGSATKQSRYSQSHPRRNHEVPESGVLDFRWVYSAFATRHLAYTENRGRAYSASIGRTRSLYIPSLIHGEPGPGVLGLRREYSTSENLSPHQSSQIGAGYIQPPPGVLGLRRSPDPRHDEPGPGVLGLRREYSTVASSLAKNRNRAYSISAGRPRPSPPERRAGLPPSFKRASARSTRCRALYALSQHALQRTRAAAAIRPSYTSARAFTNAPIRAVSAHAPYPHGSSRVHTHRSRVRAVHTRIAVQLHRTSGVPTRHSRLHTAPTLYTITLIILY